MSRASPVGKQTKATLEREGKTRFNPTPGAGLKTDFG